MTSYFSHLECSVPCGAGPFDPRQIHHLCSCGAPLLARYDLTAAKRVPKTTFAGRDGSMWRYAELMPLQSRAGEPESPVSLGEGWTPLIRTRRLGKALGLERLYVKDESLQSKPQVAAFVQYYVENAISLAEQAQFVPASQESIDEDLQTLQSASGGTTTG